jgi:hypothetical protein
LNSRLFSLLEKTVQFIGQFAACSLPLHSEKRNVYAIKRDLTCSAAYAKPENNSSDENRCFWKKAGGKIGSFGFFRISSSAK